MVQTRNVKNQKGIKNIKYTNFRDNKYADHIYGKKLLSCTKMKQASVSLEILIVAIMQLSCNHPKLTHMLFEDELKRRS